MAKFEIASPHPTIGADPEVFVMNGRSCLPAFEFLPHKEAPAKSEHAIAYWDGFQAELNLLKPYNSIPFLIDGIRDGLKTIRDRAMQNNQNAKLSLKSVLRIPKETLETAFDPFVALGCESSLNVYKLHGQPIANPRTLRYRFAGGHMHFGERGTVKFPAPLVPRIVQVLDAILGVWSVGAAQNLDNVVRRRYYGLPGEYRLPKHGFEYRTLSNFWLCSPSIANFVWTIGRTAVHLAMGPYRDAWAFDPQTVIQTIMHNDVQSAVAILRMNSGVFNWMFAHRNNPIETETMFNIGINGVESVISDPHAIEKNWGLNEI